MVHILNADVELTDNQVLQICLALAAYKCIRDTETLTYYFHVENETPSE